MRKLGWALPRLDDPRLPILVFLVAYDLYALSFPQFSRRPSQWLAGMAACLLVDLALLRWRRLTLLPVSGFISCLGLLLLTDSPEVWPYALVGALAMMSKHLLRVDGRHFYNPLNFGLVAALLLLPEHVTMDAGRWGNTSLLRAGILALGVFAAWRGGRLDLSAVYMATFVAGAWLRSVIWQTPLAVACAPMSGASFHLFAFFMITDPMTTPETRRWRLAYGVMVGLLDAALRQAEYRYAPVMALFLLSALIPYIRRAEAGGLKATAAA